MIIDFGSYEQLLDADTMRQVNIIKAIPIFRQCGSRLIGCNAPDADWDFYAVDSEDNRKLIESLGYFNKYGDMTANYCDIATTAIYKSVVYPIEITLKSPEYLKKCRIFWLHMANHPDTFKECFWKSYEVDNILVGGKFKPNTREKIQELINHWLKYVL
jgi:hypothetical protein